MRLMKAFPELIMMIKGMHAAIRALSTTFMLLSGLIYVYSIMLCILLKDDPGVEVYFSSMPRAMWSLLMDGTLMDSTGSLTSALIDLDFELAVMGIAVFMS